MKMPHCRTIFAAMIAVAGVALCLPTRASTFTVTPSTSGTTATFTVTRSETNAAETVRWTFRPTRSSAAAPHVFFRYCVLRNVHFHGCLRGEPTV